MVVEQIVIDAPLGHGRGHVPVGVLEPHDDVLGRIQYGKQTRIALPQIFLDDGAVDLLGNAPPQRIVNVFYENPVGKRYGKEFSP